MTKHPQHRTQWLKIFKTQKSIILNIKHTYNNSKLSLPDFIIAYLSHLHKAEGITEQKNPVQENTLNTFKLKSFFFPALFFSGWAKIVSSSVIKPWHVLDRHVHINFGVLIIFQI